MMTTFKSGKLIQQAEAVDNVALSTLASLTSLQLSNLFVNITATFLMKRVRYYLMIHSIATDEGPFCVGVAHGNATQAEIAAAITEGNPNGPSDVTQRLGEDAAWVVAQNTVVFPQDLTGGQFFTNGEWMSLGKGIPWPEDAGWQIFIMNLDGTALTTGGEVQGIVQSQGVWLRD